MGHHVDPIEMARRVCAFLLKSSRHRVSGIARGSKLAVVLEVTQIMEMREARKDFANCEKQTLAHGKQATTNGFVCPIKMGFKETDSSQIHS